MVERRSAARRRARAWHPIASSAGARQRGRRAKARGERAAHRPTGNSQPLRPSMMRSSLPLTRLAIDRRAARHEFQQRVREPLDDRWQHAEIGVGQHSFDVEPVAEELDLIGDAERIGEDAQFRFILGRRRRASDCAAPFVGNACCQALEQCIETLVFCQAADVDRRAAARRPHARLAARRSAARRPHWADRDERVEAEPLLDQLRCRCAC